MFKSIKKCTGMMTVITLMMVIVISGIYLLNGKEDKNLNMNNIVKEEVTVAVAPQEEVKIVEEAPKMEPKTMYTVDDLNRRKERNLDENSIVEVIPRGTELVIVDIKDEWATVDNNTFVCLDYLSEEIPVIEEVVEEPVVEETSYMASRGDFQAREVYTSKMGYADYWFNVYTPSGFSIDDLYNITLHNPGLQGIEEAAYNLEQETGINSIFTMAVAAHESSRGNSDLAINRNNLFGMKQFFGDGSWEWRYFDYPSEGVTTFGQSIISYGTPLISEINEIYCPGGQGWKEGITTMMNEFIGY